MAPILTMNRLGRIEPKVGIYRMERQMILRITTALILSCLACQSLHADEIRTLGGFESKIPVVPSRHPRAAEGRTPDQQWQMDAGDEPVAGFIDSMDGNDAAIHLIAEQSRLLTLKKGVALEGGTARSRSATRPSSTSIFFRTHGSSDCSGYVRA